MHSIVVLALILALANSASIENKILDDGRIVGGLETDIDRHPYQVSVQYYGSHICGGSVLTDSAILTAAHCVDQISASAMRIRAGSSYHSSGGSVHNVKSIIKHEQYDPKKTDFDVAVLKLSTTLTFGPAINAVVLAVDRPDANTVVMASGWGATSEGGSIPPKLRMVEVPILSQSTCKQMYSPSFDITDRMICAVDTGKDSCQGDSGGPLVVPWTRRLVGVVSWGIGCARPKYPGVYASVPNLREWILKSLV